MNEKAEAQTTAVGNDAANGSALRLRRIARRAGLAAQVLLLLCAPALSWGAALTCLTGTDPLVVDDLAQIAAVRASIDAQCKCSDYDGVSKKHADYLKCAKGFIAAAATAGKLRKQCKSTVTKYYSTSTCGFPASQNKEPCVKKVAASGKVTCAIKAAANCTSKARKYDQAACPNATLCIDAADSNHDGLIGAGDSGACGTVCGNGVVEDAEECDPPGSACSQLDVCDSSCACVPATYGCCSSGGACLNASPSICTNLFGPQAFFAGEQCGCDASGGICAVSCIAGTPPPAAMPTPGGPCTGFNDNSNGTISDCAGRMWEKKDQSSDGLHDANGTWPSAGTCSIGGKLCQPSVSTANLCAAQAGAVAGCAVCGPGEGACSGDTIWRWLEVLNSLNFAGHNDWRIPTVGEDGGKAELETIVDKSAPGCQLGSPCVPAAFNNNCTAGCTVTTCNCTAYGWYWSATPYDSQRKWDVDFALGEVNRTYSWDTLFVRAVR